MPEVLKYAALFFLITCFFTSTSFKFGTHNDKFLFVQITNKLPKNYHFPMPKWSIKFKSRVDVKRTCSAPNE